MNEHRVDVIVLGGGGSGLAAASEAARAGAKVILLEKNPKLGGSTGWSVGSYSAAGTPHQKRAGILNDTPDMHFEDLGKFTAALGLESRDNLALRRILVDNSAETFQWLMDNGVVFMGPALEPPHRHPRMHNVVPGSKSYPYHIARLCRGLGVDIRLSTRATKLRMEDARVAGVEAIDANGKACFYRANRGVVITSGDFSGGRELKARYASAIAADSTAVNITNTGDGHSMALAVGASIMNGDLVHGPIMRFVPPVNPTLISRLPPYTWVGHLATFAMAHAPKALIRPVLMSFITTALGPDPGLFKAGGALVNRRGVRFGNEFEKPALSLAAQPDGVGYIVLDSSMAAKFTEWPHFVSTAPNVAHAYLPDYKSSRRDMYHEAATVTELATLLGMDAASLEASLASGGPSGIAVAKPPFVALGPVKSYMVLTDGGLKVSERHEVIGADDRPIPGLFAAGSAGQGGVLLYGHGHHIGWAFVSGRRAGQHAAAAPAA